MKLIIRFQCDCAKGCDDEELHPSSECQKCAGNGEYFVTAENVLEFNCINDEEENR